MQESMSPPRQARNAAPTHSSVGTEQAFPANVVPSSKPAPQFGPDSLDVHVTADAPTSGPSFSNSFQQPMSLQQSQSAYAAPIGAHNTAYNMSSSSGISASEPAIGVGTARVTGSSREEAWASKRRLAQLAQAGASALGPVASISSTGATAMSRDSSAQYGAGTASGGQWGSSSGYGQQQVPVNSVSSFAGAQPSMRSNFAPGPSLPLGRAHSQTLQPLQGHVPHAGQSADNSASYSGLSGARRGAGSAGNSYGSEAVMPHDQAYGQSYSQKSAQGFSSMPMQQQQYQQQQTGGYSNGNFTGYGSQQQQPAYAAPQVSRALQYNQPGVQLQQPAYQHAPPQYQTQPQYQYQKQQQQQQQQPHAEYGRRSLQPPGGGSSFSFG